MRIAFCVSLYVATFAPTSFAQTFDRARLRQSIEMPTIKTSVGVQFRSSERDDRGNRFDATLKITELGKKLTGQPEDASIYLEQHALYLECMKDEKKAKDVAAKAEGVLRAHMQTNDPKRGHLLTTYGAVLEIVVENPWSDCEKWARRAVQIAPQDWRTWTYLAHARSQQIPDILMRDNKDMPAKHRARDVLGALLDRRLKAENVDEAEKALNECLQFHDEAKKLAPTDPKRQAQRYAFRMSELMLRNGISVYRGQKPPFPLMQLDRTLLDELQATATLHPDHLLWQSQLAHQLIMLGWRNNFDKDNKPGKTFRPARPEDEKAISEALSRIEALAKNGQGETGAFCYSVLAALCSSMQDHAATEKYARRTLELDAKSQVAGEQLQQALFFQKRSAEQMQAAVALAKSIPSARNQYLLAKALVLNQRFEEAEVACLSGFKHDPTDAHCLLGMCALLMRRADDAQSLQLVRELLDKARRASQVEVFAEIEYLTTIHNALSGNASVARLTLERLHQDYPDMPRYENALKAIGR